MTEKENRKKLNKQIYFLGAYVGTTATSAILSISFNWIMEMNALFLAIISVIFLILTTIQLYSMKKTVKELNKDESN